MTNHDNIATRQNNELPLSRFRLISILARMNVLKPGLHIAILLLVASMSLPRSLPAEELDYISTISPILETRCITCHQGEDPDGHLDLSRFRQQSDFASQAELLEDIEFLVAEREMPPPNKARFQPHEEERRQLVDWARTLLGELAQERPDDPGTVVMPRWNSSQYLRVIRDLTGIVPDIERFLPPDGGAGEGFTNVGEAQSLRAVHLEKFLVAADGVLAHLRCDPVTGARWYTQALTTVPEPADRRAELAAAWLQWHGEQLQAQTTDRLRQLEANYAMSHGAYFEAAWLLRHGGMALPQAAARFDPPLSPTGLKAWYAVLTGQADMASSRYIDALRVRWQALSEETDPDALRRSCRELDTYVRTMASNSPRTEHPAALSNAIAYKALRKGLQAGQPDYDIVLDNGDHQIDMYIYILITPAGDGNEDDLLRLDNISWLIDDQEVSLNATTSGLQRWHGDSWQSVPDTERTFTAPSLLRLRPPTGASRFRMTARCDQQAAPHGSLQCAVLAQQPDEREWDFLLGAPVFGPPTSRRLSQQQGAARDVRLLASPRPSYHILRMNEAFVGFDAIDSRWLGAPWLDQADVDKYTPRTTRPYYRDAPTLRAECFDPDARTRLEELQTQLVAAAQLPHQRLLAWLREHCQNDASPNLPTYDVITPDNYRT